MSDILHYFVSGLFIAICISVTVGAIHDLMRISGGFINAIKNLAAILFSAAVFIALFTLLGRITLSLIGAA